VVLGYFHLKMALTSHRLLNDNLVHADLGVNQQFLENKIQLAEFYFARILPRTKSLEVTVQQDLSSLSCAWG
jgi:hypothetical protein